MHNRTSASRPNQQATSPLATTALCIRINTGKTASPISACPLGNRIRLQVSKFEVVTVHEDQQKHGHKRPEEKLLTNERM